MRVEASVRSVHGRRLRWAPFAVLLAMTLAACGNSNGGSPRPTDPRQIVVNAIAATAALPSLRLHAEVVANLGGLGQANAAMRAALDVDVDLVNRQFAGRTTTQMPQNPGGGAGVPAQQASDLIVTTTASFSRDSQSARWTKVPGGGQAIGPTNAQIATMLTNLLSNPAISFELLEATECTLGTCDHVLAHIDGQALGAALGPLLGASLARS